MFAGLVGLTASLLVFSLGSIVLRVPPSSPLLALSPLSFAIGYVIGMLRARTLMNRRKIAVKELCTIYTRSCFEAGRFVDRSISPLWCLSQKDINNWLVENLWAVLPILDR